MPMIGVKIRNRILLLVLVQLAYLTNHSIENMKLGREMKLCDPMNNVMFKSMSFLGKQQQTTLSNKGTCMCM